MSVSPRTNGYADMQIMAGEVLVLCLRVYDPSGIVKIRVQCFPFSLANSNRAKIAYGELELSPERSLLQDLYEVDIPIPEDAAFGKWGVQFVEFTNGQGYTRCFYRGQGKIDYIEFNVIPRVIPENEQFYFKDVRFAEPPVEYARKGS